MKRTSLTTAVIAGIAGVAGISNMASAVYLNNDGLGQILIYPYYTVNGGNDTLLTVVNTTAQGKAIKVRFLEAYDSREVLDFNLYMSPEDVWTAAVIPSGAGGAAVFTTDNSCTVPALPTSAASAQPFLTNAYTGGAADGGPTGVSRTLEGYVELIEMGTVTNTNDGSLAAITHSNGVPANCGKIRAAWASGGYWATASSNDISPATGGLFGSGAIINGAEGTIAGYNADAVDQFYASTDTTTHHFAPGSIQPNFTAGSSLVSYVFAASPSSNTPTLVTTSWSTPVDAVSSVFMADSIYNEYWTSGGASASSEWVITMPTKRFYVDPGIVGTTVQAPFDTVFDGTSCSPISVNVYDREELTTTTPVGFSPPGAQAGTSLCYEAQVVTFNQDAGGTSAVLGSNLTANVPIVGGGNGWALIGLTSTQHVLEGNNDNTFEGLPVTGFWVTNSINANVNGAGALGNYSALFRHKLHRTCENGGSVCS
jgi:hypothetical protein